jgi:hypothetical protein
MYGVLQKVIVEIKTKLKKKKKTKKCTKLLFIVLLSFIIDSIFNIQTCNYKYFKFKIKLIEIQIKLYNEYELRMLIGRCPKYVK